MFLSENAFFQDGKAIKGGVPICWPWFGAAADNPENPNHGFVRNDFWSVSSVELLEEGDSKIVLRFEDTKKTKEVWPFSFCLSLEIIIGNSLTLTLCTHNTGNQVFSITEALHSYFKVGDVNQVNVLGLEKTEYLDKLENFSKKYQKDAITFTEETDRIYLDIQNNLIINDPVLNRKICITSSGNKNVVVWNPWLKGSVESTDLEDEDYKRFVCVEIANTTPDHVIVLPGSEHKLLTNYSISSL